MDLERFKWITVHLPGLIPCHIPMTIFANLSRSSWSISRWHLCLLGPEPLNLYGNVCCIFDSGFHCGKGFKVVGGSYVCLVLNLFIQKS